VSAEGSQQQPPPDEEKKLRVREVAAQERSADAQRSAVEAQRSASRWQVWVVIGALIGAAGAAVAAGAAAYSAVQSRNSVVVAERGIQEQEQGIQEQDAENQLSTAVTALGGATAAQRVAGVTLLERNVADQLTAAVNAQSRQDAFSLYKSAVIVLANYLRSGTPLAADAPCPAVSLDVQYAADELKTLLDMRQQVMGLKEGSVAIDLSRTELCRQDWDWINFNWLSTAYLPNIDLRGAYLQYSHWGTANLSDAQFQCADLRHADLSDANLTGADLRGANLVGAAYPKTLQSAQLAGAITDPTKPWDQGSCLENSAYWDPWNAPAATTNVRRH
jgi:hypothetical protein